MPGETVRLINVRHSYAPSEAGDGAVLRGIELEVPPGDFLAIHGRSGTGKSTLLHIMGGILAPTSGEVLVGGRDLFRLTDRQLSGLRNRMLGFIFQSYYLAPTLTAVENAMVPALLAGRSVAAARRRALETLEQVGLPEKAQVRPSDLSGGQMQRVAIARALVNDPAIILADEPTGNLDEETGSAILTLLAHYQREHQVTVIMATHDPSVELHATRQLHLSGGRLLPRLPEAGP